MYIGLFILLLVFVSLTIYFSVIRNMGNNPKEERLKRIISSKNFRNNIFQNIVETKIDIPPFEVFKEVMKKGKDRRPVQPIQSVSISKELYKKKDTSKVLVTWLGHSTLLLQLKGRTILVDPIFSKRASLFKYIGPKKFDYTHEYSLNELPLIDMVLLTHDHYDHLDYSVIKKLKSMVDHFIMPLGVGEHLEYWGVEKGKIHELDWWESLDFEGIELTATPGRHFTGRSVKRFKTQWCGWSIKTDNCKIYFSGDSGFFDGFKTIGEKLGPFDLAFIECGQYSKYWSSIHMMPEESVQAAKDVKSTIAIPIHWGKFMLSIHSWYEPPIRFIQKAKEENQMFFVPQIGQTFSVDSIPETNNWFIPL